MSSWPDVFQVGIFLMLLWVNKGVLLFSYSFINSFSILFIHSTFLLYSHILLQNCFYILHVFPYLQVEFSFIFFRKSCFVCIIWSSCRYLFSLPSFTRSFWFITSSFIVCSNCIAFLISSQHIFALFFCLSVFVCCWKFSICVYRLISHPGFEFLVVFFKGARFFTD